MRAEIATHVPHLLFSLRWAFLVALGWVFKKGGSSGGGGGGGVTWANDLAGSSNTHQWLASVSGPGGGGGNVPVANATFFTFDRTGNPTSTNALLNMPGVAATQVMSIRDVTDSVDLNLIKSYGAGETTQFGDFSTLSQDTWLAGSNLRLLSFGGTCEIDVSQTVATGVTFLVGTSTVQIKQGDAEVTATPFTFDAASPIIEKAYVEFVPATSPTPPNAVLLGKADSTTVGTNVRHLSDQLLSTTLAPAGDSARPFIDRMQKSLLAVAGTGGTAAATFPIPTSACVYARVTVMGVTAAGAAGAKLSATATIRNAAGTAVLVTAAGGSSVPKNNPELDDALDAAFVGSSLTLSASLATLRVQVTNGGALANDFAVFVEIYGYHP